jgi:hypothetical protein
MQKLNVVQRAYCKYYALNAPPNKQLLYKHPLLLRTNKLLEHKDIYDFCSTP